VRIRAISRVTNLYSGSSDLSAASLTTAGPGAAPGKKGRGAALAAEREGRNCLPMAKFMRHSYGFPHFRGKSLSRRSSSGGIFDAAIVDSSTCVTLGKLWPTVERENASSRCNERNVPLRIKFGERALLVRCQEPRRNRRL